MSETRAEGREKERASESDKYREIQTHRERQQDIRSVCGCVSVFVFLFVREELPGNSPLDFVVSKFNWATVALEAQSGTSKYNRVS